MSKFLLGFCVLCLLAVASVTAQVAVFVPDNVSAVGTCNVIPFGQSASFSPGYSYIGRVPASFLSAANTKLNGIAFTPCNSGTWSTQTIRIGIGHVPTPLPVPFTFPVAGNGSFLDFTVLYDSAVQGPFTWTATANTFSPYGSAGVGSSFCWNGTNDIAFYVTYQAAVVTWDGACHRTGTEPFRAYAAGYNAAASTGSGANGLKMQLDFIPCGPPVWQVNSPASSLDIGGLQGTAFTPAITTVPVNSTVTVNFISANVGLPYEVAVTFGSPLVPAGGGGLTTTYGQILNADILSPGLVFLNGFTFTTPFPGNYPLTFGVGASPFTLSAQMLNIDVLHLDGFVLSQGIQLVVQ